MSHLFASLFPAMSLTNNLQTAVRNIEILQQIAAKTSQRMYFFEYDEYMHLEKTDPTHHIATAYGIVGMTKKFIYLGEILTRDGNEIMGLGRRARKLKMTLISAVVLKTPNLSAFKTEALLRSSQTSCL